eukprot:5764341-Amphidinium_carterae.1
MPPPTPERLEHTSTLHIIFACLLPIVAAGISTSWKLLALTDDGFFTWLVFKLNSPISATLSLLAFAPVYLHFNFQAGERYLASTRYFLLIVVLVCDFIFMSISHAYLLFSTWAMEEDVPKYETSPLHSMAVQVLLLCCYTSVIVPICGKMFWMAVSLVGTRAPMTSLQHERFMYFATVVCDVHQLMFVRELVMRLDSLVIFSLILLKDFSYIMYQFGVKAHPAWYTLVFGLFHPDGLIDAGECKCLVRAMKAIECVGKLMECPHVLSSWHRVIIDAGYKEMAEAPSNKMTFLCWHTLVHICRLPNALSGNFA